MTEVFETQNFKLRFFSKLKKSDSGRSLYTKRSHLINTFAWFIFFKLNLYQILLSEQCLPSFVSIHLIVLIQLPLLKKT
jgi:hypothetical protein